MGPDVVTSTAPLVPVHPEPVPDDERALRWVMPPGTLDLVGEVTALPPVLGELRADGTLESLAVEPTAVCIRLAPGRAWRREGARVRAALQAGLSAPEQWSTGAATSADDVLRTAVQEVIDGEVGSYVRSHGGLIELLDVTDGAVQVRLSGTCTHCPAAKVTLDERFETAVRARYPGLRSVTARRDSGMAAGRLRLPLTLVRRGR